MDMRSPSQSDTHWNHSFSNRFDALLDACIRETLFEDIAPPPTGAWERLRKAILDRRVVKSRGMWVLEEPLRDPPESPSGTLSKRQFMQAQRLYNEYRNEYRGPDYCWYPQSRDAMWNSMGPGFMVLVNW